MITLHVTYRVPSLVLLVLLDLDFTSEQEPTGVLLLPLFHCIDHRRFNFGPVFGRRRIRGERDFVRGRTRELFFHPSFHVCFTESLSRELPFVGMEVLTDEVERLCFGWDPYKDK